MKAGIITFQLAWNCGAVIQCYALQKYLESKGLEVEIINYRPKYKKYRYTKYGNPFYNAYKEWSSGAALPNNLVRCSKKFVRTLLDYKPNSEHIRLLEGFQKFSEEYLKLSKIYESVEELQNDPPKCDIYISGSDQLWNPGLTNNQLDDAYFLNFGGEHIKRITYAISACELDLNKYGNQIKNLCSRMDYISLRETTFVNELENLVHKKISICPDPSFLIDVDNYRKIANKLNEPLKDYIVVYALEDKSGNKGIISAVQKLKEYYKKDVLVISGSHKWPFPVKQIHGITPEEFLYYINNAFCVINNSFHATVFSILFNKQFVTLGFKNRSTRMLELLECLKLDERFCDESQDIVNVMNQKIDYDKVNDRIQLLSAKGYEYLDEAVFKAQKL